MIVDQWLPAGCRADDWDDVQAQQEWNDEYRKILEEDVKINHPTHYNQGQIEVWDAIDDWKLGFDLGNVVKYVARADHKGQKLADLKKARTYLERAISKAEAEEGSEVKF